VRRDDDRLAHCLEFLEQSLDLDARARVEARRRFVQEQNLGVVDQRFGKAQALLHAAAEFLDVGVFLFGQRGQFEHVVNQAGPVNLGDAVRGGEKVQILPHLEVVVHPNASGM
jgi:hypothetical protein